MKKAKEFSWKKAILLSATLGLLVSGVSLFFQIRNESLIHSSVAAEPSSSIPDASDTPGIASLGSSFNPPPAPIRLIIPAISLNATIQSIGMSWSGVNIGVPTNFTDVGWYKYGPVPGASGTAIIDGHLDGKTVPEAVFFNLQNLVAGDEITVINASGTATYFKVTDSELYDYTASTSDIFSNANNSSTPRLVLITCAGDWLPTEKVYNKRIVVFADAVSSE